MTHHALRIATKVLNGTGGSSGLVTAFLVFLVLPRFLIYPKDLPEQRYRMREVQLERIEMKPITAKERLQVAMKSNVLTATDADTQIMDKNLVCRECPVNT